MGTPARFRRFYQFGPFRLDGSNRVLLHESELVPLSPAIVETLLVLVENRGSVVAKEELLKRVWPDTVVEEGNLTHNISVLRKTLGEGAGEQRYIQTVPKRGYRFVGTVSEVEEIPLPGPATGAKPALVTQARGRRPVWLILASAVAALSCAGAFYLWLRPNLSTPLNKAAFTQLTDQPGQELYPSLSPDGNSFVYASRASGNWDVYYQRVGGRAAVNLTQDSRLDDTQPAFSPDGQRIAFRSERDGGGIFVMGATGESVRRVTDFGYNPAWSPDGQEIVCATATFQRPDYRPYLGSRLFVVNVLSGQKRLLTGIADDAVHPQWSPRGRRIAYWGWSGGARDIWTVALRGGEPARVTRDEPLDWNPVWSPDGKYLYFSSDRGGSMNLWRVPIDEDSGKLLGAPEPVTTPSPYSGQLSFSRDGRRMAYAAQVSTVNLQKVALDASRERTVGQPVPITQGFRVLRNPDVSPDGQWIAFTSVGPREDLFAIRSDGTGLRQLTDDPQRDRAPAWSPDGKRIAFCSARTGKYEIWVINADGSGLEQITYLPDGQVVTPVWSPGGEQLAASVREGAGLIVDMRRRWQDQAPERLPPLSDPNVAFTPRSWSPDGRKLVGHLRRPGDAPSDLAIYSLESRTYRQLTDFGSWPVWLSDSRRLLFNHEDKILLIDSQSGRVREVFSYAPHATEHGFGLSHDDRWIYFSLAVTESDVWLMSVP